MAWDVLLWVVLSYICMLLSDYKPWLKQLQMTGALAPYNATFTPNIQSDRPIGLIRVFIICHFITTFYTHHVEAKLTLVMLKYFMYYTSP